MATAPRSPSRWLTALRRWLKGCIRPVKRPSDASGLENAKRSDIRTAASPFEHPAERTAERTGVKEWDGDVSGTCIPGDAPFTQSGASQVPPRSEESPIWLKSIERFGKEHPNQYKLITGELDEIRKLKDGNTWETWLSSRDLDESSIEMNHKWLRKCKAYMPSLATVRVLAMGLSNLDPHKVAPLVTAGVFVLIELCFGLMDPNTRDKAMDLLLKTNIIINKWVSRESDLRRMEMEDTSFKDNVNQNLMKIEEGLETLYLDGLLLMCSIYGAGQSRRGRFTASFISGPPEWERAYQLIQTRDSAYGELRSEIESTLKNRKENIEVLNWIGNRQEDPEPLHRTVMERTGVNDTSSTGGIWFLETPAFKHWLGGIHSNMTKEHAFWLKGSMGTGKTTLLCRTISHFDKFPIDGCRFVPYYCHASGTMPGPRYETIIRALCRRLAWNSNGSVADQAMQLCQSSRSLLDAQLTVKTTWEPLLKQLITSSSTTIVFVLDALDECKSFDDYITVLEFLSKLQHGPNGPYLLISSQPHVPVGKYFNGSVHTFDVVQPEARNDMRTFIDSQIVSKSKEVRWKESIFFKEPMLLDELKSTLLESAGGMFRWVELWLDVFFPRNTNAVRREVNAKKLLEKLKHLERLEELPHDKMEDLRDDKKKMAVKDVYDRLWDINSNDGHDKDVQVRLFQIITASFEALTPTAVHEAVCFDPNDPDTYEHLQDDQLEILYSSFLKVNAEGFLEFEHLSAKIFVEEIRDSNQIPFSREESHRTMAAISIGVMERPFHRIWANAGIDLGPLREIHRISWSSDKEQPILSRNMIHDFFIQRRSHFHFGDYLFRCWLRHCQILCHEDQFNERVGNLFQSRNPGFEGWVCAKTCPETMDTDKALFLGTLTRLADKDGEALRPNPFLCMVIFGFSPVSHTDRPVFVSGFEDSTVRNLLQQSALHLACKESNITIVEDLLKIECSERGSCFELLTMQDRSGQIPLHQARSDSIVKILLQYEAYGTPDSTTVGGPRTSRILHWKDNSGVTPIRENMAFWSGTLVSSIFKGYRVEPKEFDFIYHGSLLQDRVGLVEIMLENGADPNVKLWNSSTSALFYSVLHDKRELATLLIEHGVSLSDSGEIADMLNISARAGRSDTIDLLLNRGVGVDTQRAQGTTALGAAVDAQRLPVVKHLLQRKADARAPQGPFRRPILQFAAATGNTRIAELLLDHGADVNAAGEHLSAERDKHVDPAFFQPPLASAALERHRSMAEFLLRNGADIALLDTESKTALDTLLGPEGQGDKGV